MATKPIKLQLSPTQQARTQGVATADTRNLRGKDRDTFVRDFERGYADGAEEERARWRRLAQHPKFWSQSAFATELYARTGDLDQTLAALDLEDRAEVAQ